MKGALSTWPQPRGALSAHGKLQQPMWPLTWQVSGAKETVVPRGPPSQPPALPLPSPKPGSWLC